MNRCSKRQSMMITFNVLEEEVTGKQKKDRTTFGKNQSTKEGEELTTLARVASMTPYESKALC